MIREVWRRVRNFFIGPRWVIVVYQEEWDMRFPCISPRWVSSPGWHFTWVGVTLYWFSRRIDIRWQDDN